MNRRIAALAIAAVAVLGLTACSGSSDPAEEPNDTNTSQGTEENTAEEEAPADQSVADACTAVMTPLTEGAATMQQSISKLSSDPQAAVDAFSTYVNDVKAAVDSVSNADVKTASTAVRDDLVTVQEFLTAAANNDASALSSLQSSLGDVQTSITNLGTVCAG